MQNLAAKETSKYFAAISAATKGDSRGYGQATPSDSSLNYRVCARDAAADNSLKVNSNSSLSDYRVLRTADKLLNSNYRVDAPN